MPADASQQPDWAKLLESALTLPGSVGEQYSRFYPYSFGNVVLLWSQGIEPQPVATYKRWQELGRQVMKGAHAREIIRPITVRLKDRVDDDGNPQTLTRFKPVRCIFPLEDTDGDALPAFEHPAWSLHQAMDKLGIKEVPFAQFDGNIQGYSEGRTLAVSQIAADGLKTYIHEIAHIEAGHTFPDQLEQYQRHRGRMEFEAEGSAYLVCNELGMQTEEQASGSRGYIQTWLRGQSPSQESVRRVFTTTTAILNAGRVAAEKAGDA